jgi:hypothetical protein
MWKPSGPFSTAVPVMIRSSEITAVTAVENCTPVCISLSSNPCASDEARNTLNGRAVVAIIPSD